MGGLPLYMRAKNWAMQLTSVCVCGKVGVGVGRGGDYVRERHHRDYSCSNINLSTPAFFGWHLLDIPFLFLYFPLSCI